MCFPNNTHCETQLVTIKLCIYNLCFCSSLWRPSFAFYGHGAISHWCHCASIALQSSGADTYVPMVGLFRGNLPIFSIGGIGVRGHAMWALPECAYSGRGSI